MSIGSELASAGISRGCGIHFATVQECAVKYVINPQRPSAIVNIGLGNKNFFATGHAHRFSQEA
jgi:hypothetical protein